MALTSETAAFTIPQRTISSRSVSPVATITARMSSTETTIDDDKDAEILRLRSLASKLRAEASQLEAEKAQQMADAAEKAFRKFDLNNDGEVSLEELKVGLERELKVSLCFKRIVSVPCICICDMYTLPK